MSDLNKDEVQYVRAAGDGACLFNSIAQAVHLDESIKKVDRDSFTFKLTMKEVPQKSTDLRLRSVEWISKNLDIPIPPTDLTIKEDIQDSIDSNELPKSINTISKYLSYMSEYYEYCSYKESRPTFNEWVSTTLFY